MSMRASRGLLSIILALLPCGASARDAAKSYFDEWCGGPKVEFCTVSFTTVLARPEIFVGRRVTVAGYLRRLHGEWALFPSLEAACHWQAESAMLIVHVGDSDPFADREHLDAGHVYVRGIIVHSPARPHDLRYLASLRVGDAPVGVNRSIRSSGIVTESPPPPISGEAKASGSPRPPVDWWELCTSIEPR